MIINKLKKSINEKTEHMNFVIIFVTIFPILNTNFDQRKTCLLKITTWKIKIWQFWTDLLRMNDDHVVPFYKRCCHTKKCATYDSFKADERMGFRYAELKSFPSFWISNFRRESGDEILKALVQFVAIWRRAIITRSERASNGHRYMPKFELFNFR